MKDTWKEELKEGLKDQIRTMARLVNLMPPKNDAELIAVVLPNLHIFAHNFIESLLLEREAEVRKEIGEGVRSSCPPHDMIPFNYAESWSASIPPPNMKCTKCFTTERF